MVAWLRLEILWLDMLLFNDFSLLGYLVADGLLIDHLRGNLIGLVEMDEISWVLLAFSIVTTALASILLVLSSCMLGELRVNS